MRAEVTLAAAGHKRGGARRAVVDLLEGQECALTRSRSRSAARRATEGEPRERVQDLDELERLRLVQRVETGQAMVRYERVCEHKEHHHHLVCDECGVVMPFSDAGWRRDRQAQRAGSPESG